MLSDNAAGDTRENTAADVSQKLPNEAKKALTGKRLRYLFAYDRHVDFGAEDKESDGK
jgi:hypothetical protein